MFAAIASSFHVNTQDFLRRVIADTGTVSGSAQVGVNEFVKKGYQSGIRAKVRNCSPFVTNAIAGSTVYLWRGNNTEVLTRNGTTYNIATGVSIGAGANDNINSGVANNAVSYNDHHIGAYFSSSQLINDYIGYNADALNQGIAFYPRYSDGVAYHDVYGGGDGTSFSIADISGLHLAEKNGATMRFVTRGTAVFTATGKLLTGTVRTNNTLIGGGDAGQPKNGNRDYCGFTMGSALTDTEHTTYYQMWQRLMKSVSSSRP